MPEKDLHAAIEELMQAQKELVVKQQIISDRLNVTNISRPVKDRWDILAALAPIISGAIIAMCGAYFTTIYNRQQLKLQEIQTIEKFIPHLTSDEKSKRAAILAISSLTDARLAAKVAAIYASEGTVSALQSIAEHGDSNDRKIASRALPRALDNMAENYRVEKRYEEAVNTYKKALALREEIYGESPRLVPCLARLADLYTSHGEFAEAEALLQKVVSIQKGNYGKESAQTADALRALSDLYREQGQLGKAESTLNLAIAIEQKLPATAGDDMSQAAAKMHEEDEVIEPLPEEVEKTEKKGADDAKQRTEMHNELVGGGQSPPDTSLRQPAADTAKINERHQPEVSEPARTRQTQPADNGASFSGESGNTDSHLSEGKGRTI